MSEAVIAVACILLAATAAHMPGVTGAITCMPLIAAFELENRVLSGHEGKLTALTECRLQMVTYNQAMRFRLGSIALLRSTAQLHKQRNTPCKADIVAARI